MRLLFLDAYYKPEKIAFTHLEEDLIEGFIAAGHEIDIICPIPTRGVDKDVMKKYKRIKYEEEYDGKVRVHRFWAPQESTNPIARALRYIWCNIRTYQIGTKFNDVDIIFANSTPPTQGLIAGKLKRRLKCKFIYSLQDIFPDSLITTGFGKKGTLMYKLGNKVSDYAYSAADLIVVISQSFKNNIIKKGVPKSKIKLIYNWVDIDKVKPVSKTDNKLFDELGIPKDIPTVVYAGNFGPSQNGKIIIDAAKMMKNDKVQFVLFGGGSEYFGIKKQAENLSNVYCFDLMPLNRVSEVYSLGDVALITNAPGVGDCGMPSKLWTIMATNTPIVASIDQKSELAEVIILHANGLVAEAGNEQHLVLKIKESLKFNERKNFDNISGRLFVIQNADCKNAVKQYLLIANSIVANLDV